MEKIVGQKKLLNKLNSFDINTFPRSVILLGEKGSGKHLITNYISNELLKLNLIDITEHVSAEYIDEIYRQANPAVYLIDLNIMTEKEQNILLKFIEEPLNNSFIILLCETKNSVLNTINNRCITFELDRYTNEELKLFITDKKNEDLILKSVRTPGKIINNNLENISDIYDLCNKMVDKLNQANFANTLTIADKINYKDEYSKFDLELFLDILILTLFNKYSVTNNINIYNIYLSTVNTRKKLIDSRLNKQNLILNYLTNIWKESRN